MDTLFTGTFFDTINQQESICNIADRYKDIENNLRIQDQKLPYFVDWLLERVFLVEITAFADDDAYTIFETMNDRGLSLSPADMLRGYLLSNITDIKKRNIVNKEWGEKAQILKQFGKDEESDAIKAWLRSQYAEEKNKDFDKIGSEFHRWVRNSENGLNLASSQDFTNFIQDDFSFYTNWYLILRKATKDIIPGFECVYYNAQHNFTLQYPVLLASLCKNDSDNEIRRKIHVVSSYLDIYILRRIWNANSIAQRDLNTTMFSFMTRIRGKSADDLSNILYDELIENPLVLQKSTLELFHRDDLGSDTSQFNIDQFRLHNGNSKSVRLILARMTDYVEVQSGQFSRYLEYVKTGSNSYEIEHIWSNHHERHKDEFTHSIDFQDYRNCIGGLLLLPKKSNASYGDAPYIEKREHYLKENLLAQSLHENTYENNPGFIQFIEKSKLPFQPHHEFKKTDLDTRQNLYQELVEQIWNPDRLLEEKTQI